MLFHSVVFMCFFPTVAALHFVLPPRYRWALLLGASYLFYAWWHVAYTALIAFSTLVDYVAALGMARSRGTSGRRAWLAVSLAGNLGLLGVFKYASFASESAVALANWFGAGLTSPAIDLLLPVGISFYTFQSLSYTIDVYRGAREPERHLGVFALYVSFFPQLVAGPIERSTRLMPQFRIHHRFDYARLVSGLRLMVWGYFLKLVLADRLADYVDIVYSNAAAYPGWPTIIATYFFAFQIFGDFAGYSFIAIGTARIMGYELMENFRRPYFAPTVGQYWREWHISLGTWFRDYVFVPLGGSRVTPLRRYTNLMIVFAVSGLWHGARWSMVLWGCLHGLYVVFETWLYPKFAGYVRTPAARRLVRALGTVLAFHLVWFGWFLFRADSIPVTLTLLRGLPNALNWSERVIVVTGTVETFLINVGMIAFFVGVQWRQGDRPMDEFLDGMSRPFRWGLCLTLMFLILLFGAFEQRSFIYFQF